MEERRKLDRVKFQSDSVIVVCDTQEKYFVKTDNVSPLGMGILAGKDVPNLVGKAIIIVASTMIMYADVNRQEQQADGSFILGVSAKEFTKDVLDYLFDRISLD